MRLVSHRGALTVGAVLLVVRVLAAQPASKPDSLPSDVVIMMDDSGSMGVGDPSFQLQKTIARFASGMFESDRLSLVIFGTGSQLAMPLTPRGDVAFSEKVIASLKTLTYKQEYTDIPGGFERALYELQKNGRPAASHVIILITDGVIDLPDRTQVAGRKAWLRDQLRQEAAKSVRVFGVGFTDAADVEVLQSLASGTNGIYRKAPTANDLDTAMTAVADAMRQRPVPVVPSAPTVLPLAEPIAPPPTDQALLSKVIAASVVLSILLGLTGFGILRKHQGRQSVPASRVGTLRPMSGDKPATAVARPKTLVGREASSDLWLDDPTISQPHAIITFEQDGYWLRDLRSLNGTFIHRVASPSAHRVDPARPELLRHNDVVRFGRGAVYIFETADGGGTEFASATRMLPAACLYHADRPPQEVCPRCHDPLCAECSATHSCGQSSGVSKDSDADPSDQSTVQIPNPQQPS